MATRAELEEQLKKVEAEIATTQQQLATAPFSIRQALQAKLAMLQGRAQALRQQIAMIPVAAPAAAPEVAPELAAPVKKAAKKRAAKKKRPAKAKKQAAKKAGG